MSTFSTLPQARSVAGAIGRHIGCLIGVAVLAGCATSKNFSNALAEPAQMSDKAAEVVASAAADVLRANALGLVASPPESPVRLVCATQAGLRISASDLGQFGEALTTIDNVATKPEDVSFAGYLRQIRKNREAINAAGDAPNVEQQLAEKARVQDYNRCEALLEADWRADTRLSADGAMQLQGMSGPLGAILAFRDLAKALLQYGEAAQREEAVRVTVAKLLPQLDSAVKNLAAPADPATFGSRVAYAAAAAGTPTLAQDMNVSNLGAALSIQRWMTAVFIRADWERLATCRKAAAKNTCPGDPDARAVAADFAVQVASYRTLARLNDKKILKALGEAVEQARGASDRRASLAEILDALSTVGDAVADIADKTDAVKQARN